MAVRVLPGAAAGWLGLYLLTYVWVVGGQDGEVAVWYVALVVGALLACVAATLGAAPSTTTGIALVLTVATALAGVITIGLLVLPAAIALAVALGRGAVAAATDPPPARAARERPSEPSRTS